MSSTPTFVTTIPLRTTPAQEAVLLKRLDAARRVYNTCLGECLRRLKRMKASSRYKAALVLPAGKPRTKMFGDVRREFVFRSKYDLHPYAKQIKNSYLGDHLDSLTVQKIATRAFSATNQYAVGKRGRPRFKAANQFDSVEGKTNKSGIRWKNGKLIWRKLVIEPIINKNDMVIAHGLNSQIKYVRIVRRKLNGRNRFYAQLVNGGETYQNPKNFMGKGAVGLDLGPQMIAIVSAMMAELRLFAAELVPHNKEIASLQRKIERQRRANNPDNYYPGRFIRSKGGKKWVRKYGRIKPGHHKWHISNAQRANMRRLTELQRKQAAHRKGLHSQLVNHIVRMGDQYNLEAISYKSWQKMYGRSVGFRAPGLFVSLLRRKAERAGGVMNEFSTRTTRLSQVCLCGSVARKSLSERWHSCSCGVEMQRDLFSALLANCVEDNLLNAAKANVLWQSTESVLWTALSNTKSVNGWAKLPASVGLSQRQNGSSQKLAGINVKRQKHDRVFGNGVVNARTPRL